MENPFKKASDTEKDRKNRAVDFVEKNRDFFEHYADGEVKIKLAPKGSVSSFWYDYEDDSIYVSPGDRSSGEEGFSDDELAFLTCHEIEHFREKKKMFLEKDGKKMFERMQKANGSKAWHYMTNALSDIHENKTIAFRTNSGMLDVEKKLFDKTFADRDLSKAPMHLQLSFALLLEKRIPGEECKVSPEVREKINKLHSIKSNDESMDIIDVMTDPHTSLSDRIKLQDAYVFPEMQDLMDKDIERKKMKKEDDKNVGEGGKRKGDPNDMFKGDYDAAEEMFPEGSESGDEYQKAFEKWKENEEKAQKEKSEKEKEAQRKNDARLMEKFKFTEERLEELRKFVKESIEETRDKRTGVTAADEMKDLFLQMMEEKKRAPQKMKMIKVTKSDRGEVTVPEWVEDHYEEEGDFLEDPALLVAGIRSGDSAPKAWEDSRMESVSHEVFGEHTEEVMVPDDDPGNDTKFSELEITVVYDLSGSMCSGGKYQEQSKANAILTQAFRELSDMTNEETEANSPLVIKTELRAFGAGNRILKKMSSAMTEDDQLRSVAILSQKPRGGNDEHEMFQDIEENMSPETIKKIKNGDLRKIVVVLTDGTGEVAAIRRAVENLRGKGVIFVGVGITESGKDALKTYAPDGKLAKQAKDIPVTMRNLFKQYIVEKQK